MEPADLDPDPLAQLATWVADATAAGEPEPTAMVLSTAGADGRPRGRNVLLKGLDGRGLVWFTNYHSIKGAHLAENPWASVTFTWLTLEPRRQVLAAGRVEVVPAGESDAYFASRDRNSQLVAWASEQSTEVAGKAALEQRLAAAEQRFGAGEVARPPHWGGYRLVPDTVELWTAGPHRLHDRVLYRRSSTGAGWAVARLAP